MFATLKTEIEEYNTKYNAHGGKAVLPLMSRVHKSTHQVGEMVFCDATSLLEKYNCSLFVLSTSSPAGGLPLAVAITSDDKQETIRAAMEMVKEVLPDGAFHGQSGGPKIGHPTTPQLNIMH